MTNTSICEKMSSFSVFLLLTVGHGRPGWGRLNSNGELKNYRSLIATSYRWGFVSVSSAMLWCWWKSETLYWNAARKISMQPSRKDHDRGLRTSDWEWQGKRRDIQPARSDATHHEALPVSETDLTTYVLALCTKHFWRLVCTETLIPKRHYDIFVCMRVHDSAKASWGRFNICMLGV